MDIALLCNIITSFVLTYISIPPIVRVSNAKNLMDVPDHRKLNKTVIPTLGGIAIFIGLNVSSMIFMPNKSMPDVRFLYAGVIMMFFIGLKDDILIISAQKKLVVQIIASVVIVMFGHFRITNFYGLAEINHINQWVSVPLSVLAFTFLINSFNLIDGIDGLAAGIALLVSASLGGWFYLSGFTGYGTLCIALAGSLVAFLRFNLWGGENKVFMGDTGSLILGIFLAAMIIKFNELNALAPSPFHFRQAPLIAIALLIVPITDTLRVFTIRILQNKSPFSPDMNHVHHILIKSGLSHIQASSFLIAFTGLFILMALTIQEYVGITFGFFLLLGLSFASVGFLNKRSKQMIEANEKIDVEESDRTKIINLYPLKEGGLIPNWWFKNRRKTL